MAEDWSLTSGQWLLPAAQSHLDVQLFPLTAKLREIDRQGAPAGGGAASGEQGLGFTGGHGVEEEWGKVGLSVEEACHQDG